jgi:hypothetical protein
MKKLGFKSQKLEVDFISFDFIHFDKDFLIEYFWNLGFNASDQCGHDKNFTWISLRHKPQNQYSITFRYPNLKRKWCLLHFSGKNAAQFYRLLKEQHIDWTIFSCATLTRFDLAYSRFLKSSDNITVSDFLIKTQKRVLEIPRKVRFESNDLGVILKIGSRKSVDYVRIYKKKHNNYLRFEHEFKSKKLKHFYTLLKSSQLDQFEKLLICKVYKHFGKILPLQYCYTDWLIATLRPLATKAFQLNVDQSGIKTDYIKPTLVGDPMDLVRFIRFLKFTRNLDYQTEILDDGKVIFRVFTFEISSFLANEATNQNRYQIAKLKTFFKGLHKNTVIESFQDTYFQSLAAVPLARVYKQTKPGQPLIAKVWITDQLFCHTFPFYLPDLFFFKLNKHETNVRIHVIQGFAIHEVQKIFYISKFLDSYPSAISDKQRTLIKQYFINVVQIIQNYNLIENRCQTISNGIFESVSELTTRNISEGFVIFEKIHYHEMHA